MQNTFLFLRLSFKGWLQTEDRFELPFGCMQIPSSLIAAVRQRKAILFVGAGLSSSLGLPLFNVLTAHLAEELGIRRPPAMGFPALAEYFFLRSSKHTELFQWMKATWHPEQIHIADSAAHRCIVNLNFPVIYTTNYDSWLERAFTEFGKPFRRIVYVTDLAQVKPDETEIVKFHGDFEFPSSIVLTESHFLERMSLDEPLDIRLRSDSLARPILFVGYSLSDPNMRYLLYRLQQLWSQHTKERLKPNSYILIVERNEIEETLLRERGVEPIISDEQDASLGLTRFFEDLFEAVQRESSVAVHA